MSEQSTGDGGASSANDRIIEATLRLIADHGLGDITMLKIAGSAGVARQTLYNHYRDVDGIVVEAMTRHNEESLRLLDAALRVVDRPEDKLEQLVRHTVAIGAHAHGSGLEHSLGPSARVAVRQYDDALDERIREILEDGQRIGSFREDLNPDTDAALIRHLLSGVAERAATTSDPARLSETGARTLLAAVSRR